MVGLPPGPSGFGSGAGVRGAGERGEGCQGVGAGGSEDDAGRACCVAGCDRFACLVGGAGDAQLADPGGGHGLGELPGVGTGGAVFAQPRGERQGVDVGGPVRLADGGQSVADAGESGVRVVVDSGVVVGDDRGPGQRLGPCLLPTIV